MTFVPLVRLWIWVSAFASAAGWTLSAAGQLNRAGYFVQTMDESLAVVAVDLGGRPALVYDQQVNVVHVGDLQTELLEDFFGGFANHVGGNVHAKVMYGRSNHHKIEALFKAFARALRVACSRDRRLGRMLPSTKGLL